MMHRNFLNTIRVSIIHPHRLFSSSITKPNLNVAIVGAGPSGLYTAKYLKQGIDAIGGTVHIDVIEKLPTPYGLVRFGVAPDHPEVKNVENDFKSVLESENIRFKGNVNVGEDVSLAELRQCYHIVILAYGCESDTPLIFTNNSNSEQQYENVVSAREFVAWYNGHPHFAHLSEKFNRIFDNSNKHVCIVGLGNVALDCARILAKGGKGLYDTDMASHAVDTLYDNGARSITLLGRRGHVQGAFTIKELRELTKLEYAKLSVSQEEVDLGSTHASIEELEGQRAKKRIDQLIRQIATDHQSNSDKRQNERNSQTISEGKRIDMRFLMQPVELIQDTQNPNQITAIRCERTKLEGEANEQRAVGTGLFEEIRTDLVLVSIGYKGLCLKGLESAFDMSRGIVQNTHGRVELGFGGEKYFCASVYVAGWLKRGPTGIVGTNITDAKDTVATILSDIENFNNSPYDNQYSPVASIESLLERRCVTVVDWDGYLKIDKEEKNTARLRSSNQPREKLVSIKDMLAISL